VKDKSEYLIARIGSMKLGVYCRDVENVYSGKIKLVKLFSQGGFYVGIATIAGETLQVIDLRKRIGLQDIKVAQNLTVITFNTGGESDIAVIVDEIIGMKRVTLECIHKNDKLYDYRNDNIGLLFPTVALINDEKLYNDNTSETTELIHLLDSTYLDKTEPLSEDSGLLELF